VSGLTPGFHRRRPPSDDEGRLPPGQYLTRDFPVLAAGPTPRVDTAKWTLTISNEAAGTGRSWSWAEYTAMAGPVGPVDIHCVTRWSKFSTNWHGVSLDLLLDGISSDTAPYALAYSHGGYTTNVPVADLTGGKAWIVHAFDGQPLHPEHGGPARLLVPHLYFWKSAKWIQEIRLLTHDQPGFWEQAGYNNYGDPWREQRYASSFA
jgi:DMSO/TMAO reductase YedYZ molybdopterin-dependent catalytic subunit